MRPRRSPLLALALGAAVGLTGGGADPATAAGTVTAATPTTLAAAPVASLAPAAPLVVPEPLAVRAPVPATTPLGVPIAPWQLADPSAGPVSGEVEGDPEAVAVPPSLEVTEALQRLRQRAADATATGRRPARAALVAMTAALDQVGDPYVWGATGPDAFDCSGLTSWSYARAGVVIPRVSRDQYAFGGSPVDVAELLPGDLVFFATADWDPGVVHHVGMYVGSGLMVAAPRPGLTVRVEPVPAADYVGAVRPVPARGPEVPDDPAVRDEHTAAPGRSHPSPDAQPADRVGSATAAPPSGTPTGPATAAPTTPAPAPTTGGAGAPSASAPVVTPTPAAPSPSTAPTKVAEVPTAAPTAVVGPVVTGTLQPLHPLALATPLVAPSLVPLSPLSPKGGTP